MQLALARCQSPVRAICGAQLLAASTAKIAIVGRVRPQRYPVRPNLPEITPLEERPLARCMLIAGLVIQYHAQLLAASMAYAVRFAILYYLITLS